MNSQIKTLKALADETRLRIACLLMSAGKLCVCEIMDTIKMKQSAISKALRVLKDAEIIRDEREAQWVYYSINSVNKNSSRDILRIILEYSAGDALLDEDLKALKIRQKKPCKKGA